MEEKRLWYAIVTNGDNDWGTGSEDYEEAVAKARKLADSGYYSKVEIVTIDDGIDPIAIAEEVIFDEELFMNKQRRKAIEQVKDQIEEFIATIEDILEEMQECYDNMPESLQSSERGDVMSEAIENLERSISSLEEAADYLDSAVQ